MAQKTITDTMWVLLHLPDTLATRARSTWLARAQFHNRSLADPHTKQATAQTPPLLHEPIRIGVGPP